MLKYGQGDNGNRNGPQQKCLLSEGVSRTKARDKIKKAKIIECLFSAGTDRRYVKGLFYLSPIRAKVPCRCIVIIKKVN